MSKGRKLVGVIREEEGGSGNWCHRNQRRKAYQEREVRMGSIILGQTSFQVTQLKMREIGHVNKCGLLFIR